MGKNDFMVEHYSGRVVSLRLYFRKSSTVEPMNLSPQDACELAAWIVKAAGDGEHMDPVEALEYFELTLRQILGK